MNITFSRWTEKESNGKNLVTSSVQVSTNKKQSLYFLEFPPIHSEIGVSNTGTEENPRYYLNSTYSSMDYMVKQKLYEADDIHNKCVKFVHKNKHMFPFLVNLTEEDLSYICLRTIEPSVSDINRYSRCFIGKKCNIRCPIRGEDGYRKIDPKYLIDKYIKYVPMFEFCVTINLTHKTVETSLHLVSFIVTDIIPNSFKCYQFGTLITLESRNYDILQKILDDEENDTFEDAPKEANRGKVQKIIQKHEVNTEEAAVIDSDVQEDFPDSVETVTSTITNTKTVTTPKSFVDCVKISLQKISTNEKGTILKGLLTPPRNVTESMEES